MTDEEKTKFRAWLKRNTDLGDNTIGDTVCRLGRVEKIISLQSNIPADDFLFKLTKKSEFSDLSPSVKSQLRNAYKLYHSFHSRS